MNNIKIFILFFFAVIFYKDGFNQNISDPEYHYIYWEDFSETEKEEIIKNKEIVNTAIEYYTKEIKTLTPDGPEMFDLLKELTHSDNIDLVPFYFYVFNQICLDQNASLGEVKGKYCIDFIKKHPCYFFNYFSRKTKKSNKIWNCYINRIKYEFLMNTDLKDSIYTHDYFEKWLLDINNNFCRTHLIKLFISETNLE